MPQEDYAPDEEFEQIPERIATYGKDSLKPGTKFRLFRYMTRFVASIGWVGDFAVYSGPANDSWGKVAAIGNELGEDEARELFPQLEEYCWRQ
jgi:hypothetical protein